MNKEILSPESNEARTLNKEIDDTLISSMNSSKG
jgi:hypothetical protein